MRSVAIIDVVAVRRVPTSRWRLRRLLCGRGGQRRTQGGCLRCGRSRTSRVPRRPGGSGGWSHPRHSRRSRRRGSGRSLSRCGSAEARVSVETIYKAFGGRPGLVRAICASALAGEGPVPAETRSDELQIREPDPRQIIRGWGKLTTEVAPRVAPILLLLRSAAATDPQMAALRAEMDTARLARMTQNARNLAKAGHLRDDITVEQAGEVLWTYSSPELYELLVLERGWPAERYGTFIADAMTAALLPPQPHASREPAP